MEFMLKNDSNHDDIRKYVRLRALKNPRLKAFLLQGWRPENQPSLPNAPVAEDLRSYCDIRSLTFFFVPDVSLFCWS